MNTRGTGADFHERSNLACLITTALIYPVMLALALASPTLGSMIGLLIAGVILQVFALIVLHVGIALWTREEPDDERVAAIERRSERSSGRVLGVGVWLVIGLTFVQSTAAASGAGAFASPILTGHALLACFVAAELTRMTHAAVLHRRG